MDFAVKYGYTRERESNKGGHHHDQLPRDPEAVQPRAQVLSSIFRKFVSDKMKQCAGTPAMERLRSAYLPQSI